MEKKKETKKKPVKKKTKRKTKKKVEVAEEKAVQPEILEVDSGVKAELQETSEPKIHALSLESLPIPNGTPVYLNGKVIGKWKDGHAYIEDVTLVQKMKQGMIFNISVKGTTVRK